MLLYSDVFVVVYFLWIIVGYGSICNKCDISLVKLILMCAIYA
jgi:hypothetical protein